MKSEFEIGDKVTFLPYKKEHVMYVVGSHIWNNSRMYSLSYNKNDSPDKATTVTTGRSIKESKYFNKQ